MSLSDTPKYPGIQTIFDTRGKTFIRYLNFNGWYISFWKDDTVKSKNKLTACIDSTEFGTNTLTYIKSNTISEDQAIKDFLSAILTFQITQALLQKKSYIEAGGWEN